MNVADAGTGGLSVFVGTTVCVLAAVAVGCFAGDAGGIPRSGGVMPELFAGNSLATAMWAGGRACGTGLWDDVT